VLALPIGVKVQWLKIPDKVIPAEELVGRIGTVPDPQATRALHQPLTGGRVTHVPLWIMFLTFHTLPRLHRPTVFVKYNITQVWA
jgi:hypothetical protein